MWKSPFQSEATLQTALVNCDVHFMCIYVYTLASLVPRSSLPPRFDCHTARNKNWRQGKPESLHTASNQNWSHAGRPGNEARVTIWY